MRVRHGGRPVAHAMSRCLPRKRCQPRTSKGQDRFHVFRCAVAEMPVATGEAATASATPPRGQSPRRRTRARSRSTDGRKRRPQNGNATRMRQRRGPVLPRNDAPISRKTSSVCMGQAICGAQRKRRAPAGHDQSRLVCFSHHSVVVHRRDWKDECCRRSRGTLVLDCRQWLAK